MGHNSDQMIIPLAVPDYGDEEIEECLESLRSKNVTMGKKVKRFEEMWAEQVGMKYAVAVNSGSSANLLAVALWSELGVVKPGDEVIVPATTWSTSVWPLLQYGLTPVFADVDEFFTLDPKSVESAVNDKTAAMIIVPLLGNVYDPDLLRIAEDNNLKILVDSCEAHGATLYGKDVGACGDLATWSFYLSHIISTIEGGIICTNDPHEADILRSLRAHGWVKDMAHENVNDYITPDGHFDPRFLFLTVGYNLRPTELTGAFGTHQIPKLKERMKYRDEIVRVWNFGLNANPLRKWLCLPKDRLGHTNSWFGYPMVIKENAPFSRKDITTFLNRKGIDTRPIMSGDIRAHPAMRPAKYNWWSVPTPNTDIIFRRGFFVGLHSGIGEYERKYFLKCMQEFGEQYETN